MLLFTYFVLLWFCLPVVLVRCGVMLFVMCILWWFVGLLVGVCDLFLDAVLLWLYDWVIVFCARWCLFVFSLCLGYFVMFGCVCCFINSGNSVVCLCMFCLLCADYFVFILFYVCLLRCCRLFNVCCLLIWCVVDLLC